MMNFLEETIICGPGSNFQPIWTLVGYVVTILMIGVPIALVIWGMLDLGKAVIASKEDEVKKATKLLGKRFLYAVGVFAMMWFVTFILDTLGNVVTQNNEYSEDDWKTCWNCNIRAKGNSNDSRCKGVDLVK